MRHLYRLSLLSLAFFFCLPSTVFSQTPPPGITGQAFRDWIKINYYDGLHTTLGYSTARMYMYNYIDNANNTITDVYGGFQKSWTYGGTGTNPAPINCEHTIPQSFFGSQEPMQSDIHHLFPTLDIWNSTRSNYPFADIADNVTTKWMRDNQSQTTIPSSLIDEYSEYANQQFEPREDHKGDAARAIFYFYTVYPTQAGPLSNVANLAELYAWHLQDPVSTKELNRNDDVEIYQGNRNPYVDNPTWVEDAWEISLSAPAAPVLSLNAGGTYLQINWADLSNEVGFTLYRSTDNVSFSQLVSLAANTTAYNDNSVTVGTTYYYYATAYNATGTSSNSNTVSGQATGGGSGGPATDLFISEYIEGSSNNKALEIANFTGTAVDLSAYVLKKETNGSGTWGSDYALTGTLADGDVWVIANSSANASISAQADITTGSGIVTFNGNDAIGLFKSGSMIDLMGTVGDASYFAQNQTLIRKSSVSSPNAVYTLSEWDAYAQDYASDLGIHTFDGGGSPSPPAIPANLTLAATTSSLDLVWNDVPDEDGYYLYRSTDNVNFSLLTTLGANVVSFSDNTVALLNTYYYQVEAYNAGGNSGPGNTVSGATLPTPPTTPTNLSLIATTIDLNLSWDDVPDEDNYLVFRSADGTNYSQIANLSQNVNAYTDNTVQLLTTYHYYVVAENAGGLSGASNVVSGQTESTGPNASELFVSEYIEGSSFNKSLEIANFTGAPVNLSGYVLKKQTNGTGAYGSDYALSGTLAHGDVWVIANSAADPVILAEADVATGSGIVTFNGNDALALFKNGTLIDEIGYFNSAANYAQDVTLIRKESVDGPNTTYTQPNGIPIPPMPLPTSAFILSTVVASILPLLRQTSLWLKHSVVWT